MTLFEFCQWIQFSPPLVAMRSSTWLFPVIASIHLMGLAVIGGAVLVGDLRLLGFGLSRQPLALVTRDAERWLIAGLLVMVPTGIHSGWSRLAALVSLSLWTTIAIGGRWIGFP